MSTFHHPKLYFLYLFANLLIFSVPCEVRDLMVPVHGWVYSTQNSPCIRAAWSDWHWLDVSGGVRWGVAARGAVFTQSELDRLPRKLLPSWAVLGGSRSEPTGWRAVSVPPSDRRAPLLRRETASFKKQGYILPRHSQPSSLQITFSCLVETSTVSLLILRRLLFWLLFRVHLLWEFLATNVWQSHPEPATHPISTEFWYSWPISRGLLWPWGHFQPFMVS